MKSGGESLASSDWNEVAGRFLDFVTPMSGLLGTIGGKFANTAKGEALEHAYKLKAAGKGEDEIFRETTEKYGQGWWLGHPDKKPRFEIDDSKVALEPGVRDWNNLQKKWTDDYIYNETPLPFVWNNKNVIEAYPEAMNIGVHGGYGPGFRTSSGSLTGNQVTATGYSGLGVKRTIGHELQHFVSNKERFAKGGSVEEEKLLADVWTPYRKQWGDFFDSLSNAKVDLTNVPAGPDLKYVDDVENYINDLVFKSGRATNDFKSLSEVESTALRLLRSLDSSSPYDNYYRLADESQARLTQSRLDMTAAQRAAPGNEFYKHYDVPLEDMILRYGR